MNRFRLPLIVVSLAFVFSLLLCLASDKQTVDAADHGDAPLASIDRSCDIADVYAFLDPNDNTKVILAMTTQGFIVPGEAVNFGVFDPAVLYRLELETTGDATPDRFIDIRFTPKTQAPTQAQTATVQLFNGRTFTAPTTVPNLNPTPPARVVTVDNASGVAFFAGVVDDPFIFDIPGFNRFTRSVLDGAPNGSHLQRGRDTFAGYNTLAIALSLPVALFGSPAGNELGVAGSTLRFAPPTPSRAIVKRGGRTLPNVVDRNGNPAVNVVLIPFPRKNEYNLASTQDDAANRFTNSIVATLRALGTNDSNIGILAQIAVVRGDYLRLKLDVQNVGAGGGNNGAAAFPNGRRLGDDVVDTLLTVVTNGFISTDNANTLDVPLNDTFPFFGNPHQPFEPGTVDDRTRN